MLEKCTNPASPFYRLDSTILAALEGAGIDLPCTTVHMIGSGIIAALCGAIVLGFAFAAIKLR